MDYLKSSKSKRNKITFISLRRNEISGNFAFVYDKIKDDKNLDIHFILNEHMITEMSIKEIIEYTKACATSKLVVLDEYTPMIHYIDLRKETKLIQLWHACGAFKTFIVPNIHPIPAEYSDRVIDLSEQTEINDLLFVADLIITDYSSLISEASLMNIPMIFYVFDLEKYINDRDFYFDFKEYIPGKIGVFAG